jgi:hypothetical protein
MPPPTGETIDFDESHRFVLNLPPAAGMGTGTGTGTGISPGMGATGGGVRDAGTTVVGLYKL